MPQHGQGNVFITGSTGGIGAAVTDLLVQRGYTVYAGVHTTAPSRDSAEIRSVAMDVTDPDSVARAAAAVAAQVGAEGLHAVINNAGIIVQGPLELVTPDQLRHQFDVNTLGPAYVCREFLPLVRAGRGRIVNISAPTARIPIPFMAPISASKAALASWSNALRLELSAWDIPVVLVEPGGTRTEIFAKAELGTQQAISDSSTERVALYRGQLEAVAAAGERMKLGPVGPVARAVVRAVTTRKPKRHYAAGTGVRTFALLAHLPVSLRERAISTAYGLRSASRVVGAV
ncbi:SDR family NAD(P)-dependent oxidoreductase [Nocardia sp. CA-135398]|uniref:SDR family NAD(P)-dependent oxidoreductase n=1 Tax=Nocardia sp. CA-135398 TaxID=3239977 RepID=UPI003D97D656